MKKTEAKAGLKEVAHEEPSRKRFIVKMEVEGDMLDKDTPISAESLAALFQLQYQSEKVLKILKLDVKPMEDPLDDQDQRTEFEPDFEITKITKFESNPASYKVLVRKNGEKEDHEVGPIKAAILTDFPRFRKAFFEATENKFITFLPQWQWERMVSAASLEVRSAPKVEVVK